MKINLSDKKYLDHLSRDTLLKILEGIYQQIYVVDHDGKIIYVNRACIRHYGLKPEDMIGKYTLDLWKGRWEPTGHWSIFNEKRRIIIEQKFCMGQTAVSTVEPILDDNDEIELVVSSSQEKLHNYDISFKHYDNLKNDIKLPVNEDTNNLDNLIITESASFNKILKLTDKASQANVPILLLGESGTGKSFLAKHIHEQSKRKNHPLLSINCATIPENLLESELFGYVPHAFTGANPKGKIGLLELADKGTLFLDEIGELSIVLQAKLLTVLDNKTFFPVGAKSPKVVDIRIIAATNQNITQLIKEKKFREDLYWRLNVVNITLPTLRERKKDIIPLANYFLNLSNEKYEYDKAFSPQILDVLNNYCWPGNIRQLKNVVERSVILSMKNSIELEDFPPYILEELINKKPENKKDYEFAIDSLEKRLLKDDYINNTIELEKLPPSIIEKLFENGSISEMDYKNTLNGVGVEEHPMKIIEKKYYLDSEKSTEDLYESEHDNSEKHLIDDVNNKNAVDSEDFSLNLLELLENDLENTNDYQFALDNLEKSLIEYAYLKYKTTRKVAESLKMSQSKASRLKRKYNIKE